MEEEEEPTAISPPPAFNLFPSLKPPHKTLTFHQISVLLITFLSYASFHASRKPPSIVKSVLGPELTSDEIPAGMKSGWAPFNGSDGLRRLGELDLAFLSAYAVGMYFAGHIGDRMDLRVFLTIGMVGSGALTMIFGLGFWLNVHVLWFFVLVQIVCGLFQSIGWPCVVSVVGNWFGKSSKRGLIMGIWNSNTSVGNIIGSVVASSVLGFGWGWSFLLPGLLVMVIGVLVYMFLVVNPEDIGLKLSDVNDVEDLPLMNLKGVVRNEGENGNSDETMVLEDVEGGEGLPLMKLKEVVKDETIVLEGIEGEEGLDESKIVEAIGFLEAWRLPGVVPFAFCLFFSKLVAYTFLYWLPFYIRHTAVAGVHLSDKTAGILSTIFDIGGVIGGITAGLISDLIQARATTSILFLLLSIPALIIYRTYGSISTLTNTTLMFLSGLFINGPYALITTAVAADLATQTKVKGNSRALATVTAIIDGTGSIGAALGPVLAGYVSTTGWNSVFFMLIVSISFAGLFLIRVVKNEILGKINEGKWLFCRALVSN